MRLLRWVFAFLCAVYSLAGTASAVVLDWSALTWPAGSLSNSYDVDPSSPGNDVTVTISDDTGQLQPSLASPFPQTPAITRAFDGGLVTSPRTLELALDLSNNSQFVTVTINFSAQYAAGVSNVSLQLFDIDYKQRRRQHLSGRDSIDLGDYGNWSDNRSDNHWNWI